MGDIVLTVPEDLEDWDVFEVAEAFLKSESLYTNIGLRTLTEVYQQWMGILLAQDPKAKILDEEDFRILFANIEAINSFHLLLYEDLLALRLSGDWEDFLVGLGELFQRYIPHFKLYAQYITNYRKAAKLVVLLLDTKPKFKAMLLMCQQAAKFSLQGLMQLPVTRMPQYLNYLGHIYSKCNPKALPSQLLAETCLEIKLISDKITKRMRDEVARHAVVSVQENFFKGSHPLVSSSRFLIKKGILKVLRASMLKKGNQVSGPDRDVDFKPYYVFLFNDVILTASQKHKKLKFVIRVEGLMFRKLPNATHFSIKSLLADSANTDFKFVAANPKDATSWKNAIQKAIYTSEQQRRSPEVQGTEDFTNLILKKKLKKKRVLVTLPPPTMKVREANAMDGEAMLEEARATTKRMRAALENQANSSTKKNHKAPPAPPPMPSGGLSGAPALPALPSLPPSMPPPVPSFGGAPPLPPGGFSAPPALPPAMGAPPALPPGGFGPPPVPSFGMPPPVPPPSSSIAPPTSIVAPPVTPAFPSSLPAAPGGVRETPAETSQETEATDQQDTQQTTEPERGEGQAAATVEVQVAYKAPEPRQIAVHGEWTEWEAVTNFFQHNTTGEKRMQLPTDEDELKRNSLAVPAGHKRNSSIRREPVSRRGSLDDFVASEWEATQTAEGHTYWWNTKTDATTWTDPFQEHATKVAAYEASKKAQSVPAAPMIPSAPSIPTAPSVPSPPPAPAAPIAPPLAAPAQPKTGGGGGMSMASMLGSVSLKKAAPVQKTVNKEDALLAAIRGGGKKALKKTVYAPKPEPEPEAAGGLQAALAKSLAQYRQFVQVEEEEEDLDDWD